jgi:hypothetical protein
MSPDNQSGPIRKPIGFIDPQKSIDSEKSNGRSQSDGMIMPQTTSDESGMSGATEVIYYRACAALRPVLVDTKLSRYQPKGDFITPSSFSMHCTLKSNMK